MKNVQDEEMVVFLSGVRDMSLNLELDNVGVALSGNDKQVKELIMRSIQETLWMTHVGKQLLYPIIDTSAYTTNRKGLLGSMIHKQVGLKAPGNIP